MNCERTAYVDAIRPSFHTVWPMSLMVQALTSTDPDEVTYCLRTLAASAAGTGFMHESFYKDNFGSFTRPWFAWANSLFSETVLALVLRQPGV
jgi:meiotically up-regulated gene 157 (Mug157) protein